MRIDFLPLSRLKNFIVILSLFFGFVAHTQTIQLTGIVQNTDGEPIYGASVAVSGIDKKTYTSKNGGFNIGIESNQEVLVEVSYINHVSFVKTISVGKTDIALGIIQLIEKSFDPVNVTYKRPGEFIEGIPEIELSGVPSVTGNFEDIIKVVGLGVNANNELTANYNVRGGNYDENLIYVNGIQIYRPFLARSGQQEGLSFINPAFVDNIAFSAGGFDNYYGDKLSSVLDIRYRTPKEFGGSGQLSLMGGQAHIEGRFGNKRGNYITGARYRNNGYLLNSLPAQGDYNPVFFDYQFLTNYYLNFDNENRYTNLFVLGHYSNNNYRFIPSTRNTSWGTVNEAYQLRVYYDGQEETRFKTFTGAIGIENKVNKNLTMRYVASAFRSEESEYFDILGQYLINQLETDPSKEEFGDSTSNVGIGGFLDHGRNDLSVWIGNVYHDGKYTTNRKEVNDNEVRFGDIYWGAKVQYEYFHDVLSEWNVIDSAGYFIPQGDPNTLELKEVIKQDNIVESFRTTGYIQYTQNIIKLKTINKEIHYRHRINDTTRVKFSQQETIEKSPARLSFSIGTRGGYRTYNNEYWITPRANISFTPRSYFYAKDSSLTRRNMKLKFASGLYYQPPLYRTMRVIDGTVNADVVSQKSWHNVAGAEFYFNMWDRPFKFTSEAYYKYMWDVVPYEIDNVRIRYYGDNMAVAYAYGVDAKVNGEFVKGVESFFRIGFLQTREDIIGDSFTTYFNSDGDTIIPGYTFNDVAVDSTVTYPGFIPRPTDQMLTFSVFFQDQMPKYENFKVSLNLIMGTPLPYGPPTYERYKDTLRSKGYLRLDLGFMYDILDRDKPIEKRKPFFQNFEQMTLNLDVFNLLGVNNIISYQWLQDITGQYYAIPNHLTGRRVNLRFIVKF